MNDRGKNRYINPGDDLVRLSEAAKLKGNPLVQRAITSAVTSQDPVLYNALKQKLSLKANFEAMHGIPFNPVINQPRTIDQVKGKIILLGKILGESIPFVYLLHLLNRHCFIAGSSGSGKTTLLFSVILQAIKHSINVVIFDRSKMDFRHLKRLIPDFNVFNIEKNFIFNPLQVPTGVKPMHWLSAFVTVFAKNNSLLDGSESLLIRAVKELYEQYGVFRGQQFFPTILDLYAKVRNYQFRGNRREAGYQDSIINRLYAYISLHRSVYEYSQGIPIEWIAANSFVLEVGAITERIARFQMSILLYALFMHKIAINDRGNYLKSLVVIDECKWVAPPGYNQLSGHSPLTYILSQSREAGIGLVLADQTANLEDSLMVNTRLKCCFHLGNGDDIQRMARAMSLTREQADYITSLETGECIIRIPEEDPFLIKTLQPNLH